MFNRRKIDVSVAVLFEPEWGFFLSYNPKWHGYTLPMRKFRPTDANREDCARAALRDATDLPLRGATVSPLVVIEVEGESQRTREPTLIGITLSTSNPRRICLPRLSRLDSAAAPAS